MNASIIAVLARSYLLYRFCMVAPLAALPFATSEFLALLTTISALCRAKRVDHSVLGASVAFLYGSTLLFRATGPVTVWIWPFLLVSLIVVLVRVSLFDCLTVGAPVLVRVKRDGCYRYTRHPLATAELLSTWLFLAAFPTGWNCVVAIVAAASIVLCALVEEHFLLSVSSEYYGYTREVRKRFVIL